MLLLCAAASAQDVNERAYPVKQSREGMSLGKYNSDEIVLNKSMGYDQAPSTSYNF